jgi:hypothetical protein
MTPVQRALTVFGVVIVVAIMLLVAALAVGLLTLAVQAVWAAVLN